jgi:hypothetical protein
MRVLLPFWGHFFRHYELLSLYELLGIWEEKILIYFKVLSKKSPRETKTNEKTTGWLLA